MRTPSSEAELDELLSTPTPGVLRTLSDLPGTTVVLGAGGKMGGTVARMLRRASRELGDGRRIIAVSRFSSGGGAAASLERLGVEVVPADLADPDAVRALPDASNVIFMAGQKFGTQERPGVTWTTNAVLPALAARRYRGARIVAFSTGNVYPLVPASSGGSREGDSLAPVGEYAWSCLARERVLEQAAAQDGTRIAIVRLNYAVDLRYGVLVDVAQRVRAGTPIELRMGFLNAIWQGDATAQAIGCLALADSPPFVLNVAGPEILAVREVAQEFGRLLGREPIMSGQEGSDALLSNSARAQALFGPPSIAAGTLIGWVAAWLQAGGRTLGKATGFEQREGRF